MPYLALALHTSTLALEDQPRYYPLTLLGNGLNSHQAIIKRNLPIFTDFSEESCTYQAFSFWETFSLFLSSSLGAGKYH